LSGTTLNPATIDSVSTYLALPQSDSLHELYLDNTYLSGSDVATLLHSLSWDKSKTRDMHLDISQCLIGKGLEKVTSAIASNLAPSHLTMKAIEYKEEGMFRKVIKALTINKNIRFLDMSQIGLPGDASEETCEAIARLLARNETLLELDLSGDDSRLATSKFGPGINEALAGLCWNKTLKVFRIEKQKLGVRGASTLAEVVRENQTLLELHCDNNEIPLAGLTDLVNSLIDNTALIYLPSMNDGRAAAFRSAEATMKVMSDDPPRDPPGPKGQSSTGGSAVRKGFASVRKTTSRAASQYTPSFPNLPYSNKASSSTLESRSSSPMSLTLPAGKKGRRSSSSHHSRSGSASGFSAFTIQDIQTTQRLLTEQWDRQCYRLEQYLHRNWCLLHNLPCNMEVEDEKFERPSSVGSIGRMLEQVKYDTTPKADLDATRSGYFDSPQDSQPPEPSNFSTPKPHHYQHHHRRISSLAPQISPLEDKHGGMSFQHWILDGVKNPTDGGSYAPAATARSAADGHHADGEPRSGNMRPLRLDTGIGEHFFPTHESMTPTQKSFGVGPSVA
jgi:hypothetical protein